MNLLNNKSTTSQLALSLLFEKTVEKLRIAYGMEVPPCSNSSISSNGSNRTHSDKVGHEVTECEKNSNQYFLGTSLPC